MIFFHKLFFTKALRTGTIFRIIRRNIAAIYMVSSKASLGQDEVVDDSEPERAELRRRERNVQKISHSGRLHRRGQFCEVQEIIEITDGEDSDNNDRLGPKIINLSGAWWTPLLVISLF